MFVFESAPINLSSLPSPAANAPYLFYCNVTCCRNLNDNTLACSNTGDLVLRCYMYRYIDPITNQPVPPGIMCDNSPVFTQNPTSIYLGLPTVVTNFYNNAEDIDNEDFVIYSLQDPWSTSPTGTPPTANTCGYKAIPGYPTLNINYPFPGIIQVNGKGIDSTSGTIYFNPVRLGNYTTCISVNSYRCGQLISTIIRDFQIQVIAPPANYPSTQLAPEIQPPFEVFGSNPPKFVYDATFFAGDTIKFNIETRDFFPNIPAQMVTLIYKGLNFGTNFSQNTGCNNPPCATLNGWPDTSIVATPILQNGQTLGYGFVGSQETASQFKWITSINNLSSNSCGVKQRDFTFNVTAVDDQCPVPGRNEQIVRITLLPPPLILNIKIKNIIALPNGNVNFELDSLIKLGKIIPGCSTYVHSKTVQEKAFEKAILWRATNINGPYTLLSTINNPYLTSYSDLTANVFSSNYYYYAQVISGGYKDSTATSDTLAILKSGTFVKENKIGLNVYPNPMQNEINIELEQNNDLFQYQLVNAVGQVVSSAMFINKTTIQTSRIPDGIYTLKLENDRYKLVRKLIKSTK